MSARVLHASLDVPLPAEVGVGGGTAVFVAGTCYCPHAAIEHLELIVDGEPQPLEAFGMPRLDFFADLHPRLDPYATAGRREDPDAPADPGLRSYRSGFWGVARLARRTPGSARTIGLRARLAGGEVAQTALCRLDEAAPAPAPAAPPWPDGHRTPAVAIAMATYNPPADLFAAQVASLRAQTHANWVCVISDDGSSPRALATIEREIAGDARFLLSRGPRRLGFYGNFARALGLVPADADYVALADQDDRWDADKLACLLDAIGGAQLVYSDARLVSRDGRRLADTYWTLRRNNHSDLLSLLVANSVTGAASLMRRDLLDDALPFPPAQFHHYHDHWIALTALCRGEIAFVERPLYDYVQHGEASLGHAAANQMSSLVERLRERRPLRERVRAWRLHYFVDVCRLLHVCAVLQQRVGPRMAPAKRRALARFAASGRSPVALAALTARGAREVLGIGRPETLGAEWMLAHAFAWRRLVAASARERPQRRLRLDAVPPPALALTPARTTVPGPAGELADKVSPLALAVSDRAPARVNLLIPTVDLRHFFGGYIAMFNLARRLAQHGVPVRLVTTDPVGPLAPDWRAAIESFSGLRGLFDAVDVRFGRGPTALEVSPGDAFIATTWWTAHIAAAAQRSLSGGRFLYLIQEYEPFTFPMGSFAALAAESYELPHAALFSSELLRGYFRRHGVGVYADGGPQGDAASRSFQNAITVVPAPTVDGLAARSERRLLFYARPEAHAARNMYEVGLLALARAAADGVFGAGWVLRGIGTVSEQRRVPLGAGAELELIPRAQQGAYAELLAGHDVGLALMYTPHPSLVPIEMASAGMVTVTNRFENKTPEALEAISTNLVTVAPTVEGIAEGVREAVRRTEDHPARVRGSQVAWSRKWEQSFDAPLLDWVSDVLAVGA